MKIIDIPKRSTMKSSFDPVFEEKKGVQLLIEAEKEELRRKHQAKLTRQKNRETARRLASANHNEANLNTLNELIGCNSADSENKFKPIRLPIVYIYPLFGGPAERMTGALVAHANGFRYSTSTEDEMVDIMYANIKHAFFQTATDEEMIVLLHLHLHEHLMVGNKKTKDVQFYMDGFYRDHILQVQTHGDGARVLDCDFKDEINIVFQDFVNRVHDLWLQQPECKALGLEFEQPLIEQGFYGGVLSYDSSLIVPTSSCLVELKWSPFLIITLSEIEIVNLERIRVGQKNFDMAIVFKDFKRDVVRIACISFELLGDIKEWLDSNEVVYFESRVNLNWGVIMKTFIDEPQAFIDVGGWEFMRSEKEVFYEDGGFVYLDFEATDTRCCFWDILNPDDCDVLRSPPRWKVTWGDESESESELEREESNNNSCNKEERRRSKMKVFGSHKMKERHWTNCREKQAPTTLTERKQVRKRKEMNPSAARRERKRNKKKMKAASSGKRRVGPGTSFPKRYNFT